MGLPHPREGQVMVEAGRQRKQEGQTQKLGQRDVKESGPVSETQKQSWRSLGEDGLPAAG